MSFQLIILPEEVFIKGMISRVAEKLKVEPKPLLTKLKARASIEEKVDLPIQKEVLRKVYM